VAYFRDKFGVDIAGHWRDEWRDHRAAGYVEISDDRIELTRAGLLQVDSLLPAFFEPEHQGVRYT
jgi:oxygen-independent coproporphyrinogen-3 oxidase